MHFITLRHHGHLPVLHKLVKFDHQCSGLWCKSHSVFTLTLCKPQKTFRTLFFTDRKYLDEGSLLCGPYEIQYAHTPLPTGRYASLQGSHYDRQYNGLSTSSFPSATLPLVFWTPSPLLLSVLHLPYLYIGCQSHEQFHKHQQPIQTQSAGFSRRVPQGFFCLNLPIHYKQVMGRLHSHISGSQAVEPQRETTYITVLCRLSPLV